ncbi:hypothetical protein Bcep18194_A4941 [Burkholderia lata]|uniref:Uncharacterized protein n=1 Tax=Burkholderia lata (strain ATCC 17760 / DSM 23089 / LMG 22485 / NCIMB 9086 / R18194 / 383) TaxID=482957 RepID=Q39G81_BURL3|nr:hypothetical protein Bcep18194_A4941 [Burkholderia lata]
MNYHENNTAPLIYDDIAGYVSAQLNARIDTLARSGRGGLIVPVTPGPFFVLLALAEGSRDVRPAHNSSENAVEALRSASPGGHAIANRTSRMPARTYCFGEPHRLGDPCHAYVHIHDDSFDARRRGVRDSVCVAGMIEIACAMPVDPRYGISGLYEFERTAAQDANALQVSFDRLGLRPDGPLFAVAALLQVNDLRVTRVSELTNSPEVVGMLRTPVVRMMPQRIEHMKDLTGPRLKEFYSSLWTDIQDKVTRRCGGTGLAPDETDAA